MIERKQNGDIIAIVVEDKGDNEYLEAIIKYTDRLNKRVSDAQRKMHETNLELVKIKKSWVYKVLAFISNNFSLTKPRGCK